MKGTHRTLLGDEVETIYVKGSGRDLATLEPDGLPGLDVAYLKRLRSLDSLTDKQMVNELRTHLFDAFAPTPSIEALLHAFLPPRFVDHSHADAVLAVTNQPDGEAMVREAMGGRVAIVPYVRPGFDLAKAVADCYDANSGIEGIVLIHHGLITFGDDARTAYERHIALVDTFERFIEKRADRVNHRGHQRSQAPAACCEEKPAALAAHVAPMLRGLLALSTDDEDHPHLQSVLDWRATDQVLAFVNSAEAKELATTGPLTGDHLIHTKPTPMFVENPQWTDDEAFRRQLEEAIKTYRREYQAYVSVHGGAVDQIDLSPRVVLLPGAGMFCWGKSKRDARITADIAQHTLLTKARAQAIGRYTALSADHLYDMEYRALQRAKLASGEEVRDGILAGAAPPFATLKAGFVVSSRERQLERHVVVISGGAGAIGAGVALVCAQHGAHVVITDLDEKRISRLVERVERRCGVGTALGLVVDVTNEESVRAGFAEIARTYGGVDVVVPNAGIAHVAAIEDIQVKDFRRIMEVNALGYLLFMREGIRILKQQGLGGHIIISASKNVFGPGRDFGAYSASKAAGHQLGKVAAIELAPYGIRVNMINADAIFGDSETPSGLWAAVGPQRAQSRNLRKEELPEYYRSRNLLKARVYGRHVGNAVVFFASNATPTTGATLPVDGGLVEAFPR